MVENIISNSISTLGMRVLRMRYYIVALICAVVAAGCSREENSPDIPSAAKVELDLASRPATRAHFDNEGHFVWDADGSMIAVISKGWTNSNAGTLVQWNSLDWYSPMNITQLDPSNSSLVLRATSASTLATNAAAGGDGLFCFSPVVGSANATLTQSASEVAVEFSMPQEFSQSASGKLEEFGDYCFIHGESTIASAPTGAQTNFTARPTTFYAIPATIRFNIKNNTDDAVRMESVKITCDKLFPDKLCWKSAGNTPTITEPEDKSGYFHTIKTAIDGGFGEKIEYSSTGTYYALCLPFDNAESLTDATLAFILESKEKIHTFNVSAAEFFKNVADPAKKKFESNKIYTLNFKLNDNSVELESVTISDWVGEPFYLPTEDVTARIKITVDYWVQDRENLNTYSFMLMFGDINSNYTMWGECNLGEYLYSSTDYTFTWRAVTPSSESDINYLATYFNGITDFKWQTPSKADFERLFSLGENIEMCKDSESGVYGLRFKSVAKPGSSIFLPCIPYDPNRDEHTDYPGGGKTVITRTLNGYYWTRDTDSENTANGILLHFRFKNVETILNENSSESNTSVFSKGLNEGANLYEFLSEPKNKEHSVRAILQK